MPRGGPRSIVRLGTVQGLDLDDGFGGVTFSNGRVEYSLGAPDGRRVVLWGDENMGYVQVFTPRNFPVSAGEREPVIGQGVVIEPMTDPANAFNTGVGLRWLAPGETWTLRWGIRHEGF